MTADEWQRRGDLLRRLRDALEQRLADDALDYGEAIDDALRGSIESLPIEEANRLLKSLRSTRRSLERVERWIIRHSSRRP